LGRIEILEKYTGNKELILILGHDESNRFVPDRSNWEQVGKSIEFRWPIPVHEFFNYF
jgi:hypothetical protein